MIAYSAIFICQTGLVDWKLSLLLICSMFEMGLSQILLTGILDIVMDNSRFVIVSMYFYYLILLIERRR